MPITYVREPQWKSNLPTDRNADFMSAYFVLRIA
jgi:hypothetical protein